MAVFKVKVIQDANGLKKIFHEGKNYKIAAGYAAKVEVGLEYEFDLVEVERAGQKQYWANLKGTTPKQPSRRAFYDSFKEVVKECLREIEAEKNGEHVPAGEADNVM